MHPSPSRTRFAKHGTRLAKSALSRVHGFVPWHTGFLLGYYALRVFRWSKGAWLLEALGFIIPWLFMPTVVLLPASIYRQSRRLIGLAILPAGLFLASYGHLYLPNNPETHAPNTITVVTFNVHYLNHDIEGMAATIEEFDPDLIGVHELLRPSAELLSERLMSSYPHQLINSAIGLFSRYPLYNCDHFRMGFGTGYYAQKCELKLYRHSLTVFNVHPRSPFLPGEETAKLPFGMLQRRDVQDLLFRIEATKGPLLVIGDFNMSDQQAIYAQLTSILQDAHSESGWGQGFTFTGSPKLDLAIWRIDYILYSPDIVSINTQTGKSGNSDHRPLISTLAFR